MIEKKNNPANGTSVETWLNEEGVLAEVETIAKARLERYLAENATDSKPVSAAAEVSHD